MRAVDLFDSMPTAQTTPPATSSGCAYSIPIGPDLGWGIARRGRCQSVVAAPALRVRTTGCLSEIRRATTAMAPVLSQTAAGRAVVSANSGVGVDQVTPPSVDTQAPMAA